MSGFLTGNPRHPAPEPLEGPVVGTITAGTIIWFALFLLQLPFYGWYSDHGHTAWIWTCLAGAGLGLIGIRYVRGRDAAIKRAAAAAVAATAATDEPESGTENDGIPGADGRKS
ncbi:DUF2530 domain-containing protein [Streptomyces paludis]|uniref:DUF2530 domain-containing protein n=1 Tax=Streptomyces paludis TaxID=2282738 RepID=A0A345HS02_9ACTN|nr:DUF2530 domain-containing protein [Streptomyces paludis]AXG79476.1 DUF2530 domain-containing protein [Streptomyces paludis]